MEHNSKILVAGAHGLVGSAVVRELKSLGHQIVWTPTKSHLDFRNQGDVNFWFSSRRPEYVFLAAAVVGGIEANSARPLDFILDNLQIQVNILSAAAEHGVKKLIFLGSSCIYPRLSPQPIPESALLSGPLEPSNQWYALAKIAGVKICEALRLQVGLDFVSVMPTNLYGPGDNYDPAESHVIPALIHRFHHAMDEKIKVWGTVDTRREFLFVDDLAKALILIMNRDADYPWINVGYGSDVTMAELAFAIADVVGIDKRRVEFDESKPSGTPRKLLDSSRIQSLGWSPTVGLRDGLAIAYTAYQRTHWGARCSGLLDR